MCKRAKRLLIEGDVRSRDVERAAERERPMWGERERRRELTKREVGFRVSVELCVSSTLVERASKQARAQIKAVSLWCVI